MIIIIIIIIIIYNKGINDWKQFQYGNPSNVVHLQERQEDGRINTKSDISIFISSSWSSSSGVFYRFLF